MTLVTVTGHIVDANERPHRGQVELTPTLEMHSPTTPLVVPRATIFAPIGADGTFAAELYATDDPGTTPGTAKYALVVRLLEATKDSVEPLYFALPHAVAPIVDLSQLTLTPTP